MAEVARQLIAEPPRQSMDCLRMNKDDTSIATEVKVPILMAFHRHIYDREWQFACGTKNYRVVINKFHHVSTAFMELGRSYQEVIEDVTMRMGAGMAKFICKEIETIDDYDEYCYYVAGLVGSGSSRLFHASGMEDLPPCTFFETTPGIMLLIFTKAPSHVPLKILSIEDGTVLKSFNHLLHRNKKVDFIEQFNEELLVKQDNENLQILDVSTSKLIEISRTEFMTSNLGNQ
ncbi:Squalene synthase [Forsythia ovata]|uniref:Squalene synthase n=1 Tax=Forsythia ovata TaxID=205694 RepID=A0ABD1PGW6_9LAMI